MINAPAPHIFICCTFSPQEPGLLLFPLCFLLSQLSGGFPAWGPDAVPHGLAAGFGVPREPGFVFGAGGVSVALVLRDMLMSRKDLTSTCTWGDPLVVPSWEHPGGSLPPASGDMCPSVPSPPPGPRAALQCLIRGHGAGWWSRSGWPAPAWTFYGG